MNINDYLTMNIIDYPTLAFRGTVEFAAAPHQVYNNLVMLRFELQHDKAAVEKLDFIIDNMFKQRDQ